MASTDAPLFDAWTPLAFKRVLGNREQPGTTFTLPVWTGDHARRLMAYQVLQAFIDNAGRHFLTDPNEAVREQHREYGDAALIRDQVLSALLGETQQIVTDRADEFDPEDEDEQTTEVDPNAPEGEATPEEPEPVDPEIEAAWAYQEWVRDWADKERFPLKVIETERNAVGLGDGVYSLGWSGEKKRVRLRCWDPGFYFPVLGDGNEDDYPEKVHIAWEVPPPKTGPDKDKVRIRRITWELVDIGLHSVAYQTEQTTKTCYMSDGTFTLDMGRPEDVEVLTEASVKWADYTGPDGDRLEWHNIDLGIDFIPVIHDPNTISLLNHFGRSSISTVMQILDDLANTDTDLQAASATTGSPVITLSGSSTGIDPTTGQAKRLTYRPGEVIETGDGKMESLDTSKSLVALIGYTEHLLDRLSVNSRLPGSILGRQNQKDIKSGIHLQLTFGPLRAMVEEMRLVRNEKYPLLFKMQWRISKVSRAEGCPPAFMPTTLELGSFLPSDESTAIEAATNLLKAHAISLETSVQMLINAGLPIEDAAEEVRLIEERMFEAAVALLEALGDEAAVAEFLGRVVPPAAPAPSGVGSGAGGTPVIVPPPGVPVATPQPGEIVPPVPTPEQNGAAR